MILVLSMFGSAILRSSSVIGDEDGPTAAFASVSGWDAGGVLTAKASEKALGVRIVADRFASLARRMIAKHSKSAEIKMTESNA